MIAQSDAGGEPGAMVVHLEDAPPAGRAMVRAVGFTGLAFLAEANLPVGLDGEGGRVGGRTRLVGGQGAVTAVVGRAARRREHGRSVGPVQESVEDDGKQR